MPTAEAENQESFAASPDERAALIARRAEVREDLDAGVQPSTTLVALAEIDQAIRAFDHRRHAEQVENLVKVHEAMARLRACETTAELICAAPRELCDSCGFTRALISRVESSVWIPQTVATRDGADPRIADLQAFVESARIPLGHMLLETDLVRRRVPALVRDPAGDPHTSDELAEAWRSTSYVAAPIAPDRHVIGLLHADRFGDPEPVCEGDRDMIWTFAEHFGLLFERTVLTERLVDQRARLAEELARVADGIDDLYSHELELVRRGTLPAAGATRGRQTASRVDALLTAREREVLDLLATGATNAAVGRQLVVSEGTIKSHIKRIHRKLHVNNRAEAIAKYLHLVALDEERSR